MAIEDWIPDFDGDGSYYENADFLDVEDEIIKWSSAQGDIAVMDMKTDHIKSSMRWLQKNYPDNKNAKRWLEIFNRELDARWLRGARLDYEQNKNEGVI